MILPNLEVASIFIRRPEGGGPPVAELRVRLLRRDINVILEQARATLGELHVEAVCDTDVVVGVPLRLLKTAPGRKLHVI